MFQKILVATDGSSYSLAAAEKAALIAEKFGSRVYLLHVSSSIHFRLEAMTDVRRALQEEETRAVLEMLKRTKEIFDKRGVPVVVRDVEFGTPADVICKIAEDEDFELVVVGSRGLAGVKSVLLGSVSAKVSTNAKCSVLIGRGA